MEIYKLKIIPIMICLLLLLLMTPVLFAIWYIRMSIHYFKIEEFGSFYIDKIYWIMQM